MDIISWTDEMSVSIPEIDEQHKMLIKIINEFFNAMKTGKGQSSLTEILNQLFDYTRYHFSEEERYLKQLANYSEYLVHRRKHQFFLDHILELKQALRDGKRTLDDENTPLTVDLWKFLKSWLVAHIMEADKKALSQFNINDRIKA